MVDIYNRAASYERGRAAVEDWPVHPENLRYLKRYLRNEVDRKSPGRRCSDLWVLRKLFIGTARAPTPRAPLVTKPLSALTLDDFQAIRERMERECVAKDTYERVASHLRNVYEEAFGEDPEREHLLHVLYRTGRRRFFRWRSDVPINQTIDQQRYYTFDEFQQMLKVSTRPRDRALLVLAWEGTPRPNEYLSASVGDVEELEHGFRVRLHISKARGVTRHRFAYLLLFRADFNAFWRTHPYRNKPDAPLFYQEGAKRGERLTPGGANKILKKLDRQAGIRKNGTLYFLRHGGYTWKRLQGMNPALAGKDMGWSPGGKEERRYLHLTDEEVMTERLRLVDHRAPAEPKRAEAPICPFCRAVNSPVDDRCADCGRPLNMEDALQSLADLRQFQSDVVEHQLRDLLKDEALQLEGSIPAIQESRRPTGAPAREQLPGAVDGQLRRAFDDAQAQLRGQGRFLVEPGLNDREELLRRQAGLDRR